MSDLYIAYTTNGVKAMSDSWINKYNHYIYDVYTT